MKDTDKDYQSENMTDLVQIINANNNSRKINKIISDYKDLKRKSGKANNDKKS
jgi:hypothetical protein